VAEDRNLTGRTDTIMTRITGAGKSRGALAFEPYRMF
jgi:hypothetical protein